MKKQTKKQLEDRLTDIRMNDFCPLIYVCRDKTDEWRCFGRYRRCTIYLDYCKRNSQR